MATILAQALPTAGVAPTMTAASGGGDTVDCGPSVFLVVQSGATACTITIAEVNAPYGDAAANPTFVIPTNSGTVANAGPVLIPLDAGRFGNANGQAAVTYSAVTNVKVAVVRR